MHSAASYTSSTVLVVVGGLQLSEWGVVLGILAALITAAVNWHYKRQQCRIEREVADANIAAARAATLSAETQHKVFMQASGKKGRT